MLDFLHVPFMWRKYLTLSSRSSTSLDHSLSWSIFANKLEVLLYLEIEHQGNQSHSYRGKKLLFVDLPLSIASY